MLKQVIDLYELLDDPQITGVKVMNFFKKQGVENVEVHPVQGEQCATDFIELFFPGTEGRKKGGDAPTLGIIGQLGGIGARPHCIGLVSDADGALTALAVALKLGHMAAKGEYLKGDVFITTHICPNAPTVAHHPVPFMGSPVDIPMMNRYLVRQEMDAILSVDTTRGNRIANYRGFALTPTVKEGYILPVSNDLLDIMEVTSGKLPVTIPLALQDVTPYGNGLHHLNSILQPSIATNAPVVGVAITAEVTVPGCATGANRETDIAAAASFCLETAKAFGTGKFSFYNQQEFDRLCELYGPMRRVQGL